MKKALLSFIVIAFGALSTVFAQELAPDQNPNYKASMEKYKSSHDNLQATMNTTVQSTYKAYDWSTAKTERRAENRNYRRSNYGYTNNNYGYYEPAYYRPYYSPYQYRHNNYSQYGRRRW